LRQQDERCQAARISTKRAFVLDPAFRESLHLSGPFLQGHECKTATRIALVYRHAATGFAEFEEAR
jgi:hypothetical protein